MPTSVDSITLEGVTVHRGGRLALDMVALCFAAPDAWVRLDSRRLLARTPTPTGAAAAAVDEEAAAAAAAAAAAHHRPRRAAR